MFGKSFKDINLLQKRPLAVKTSNFEIKEIFNNNNYIFIIINPFKRNKIKIPAKKFYFTTENEIKNNSSFIYMAKNYLSLQVNNKYFIFFEKKVKLKDFKVLKTLKKNISYIKIKKRIKNKYWGKISDLFSSDNSCAKEIFMKKNTQSSMEFHINKHESYFILEGELDIGLRFGRAKQRVTKLKKNNIFTMLPGTMHMRMAKKDTIIIEMSNKDDDKDSIIVHDGKKYKFKIN